MAHVRTIQLSFAGGEVSPDFVGRADQRQYLNAAARVKNWLVKPQGGLRARPGFKFCGVSFSTVAPRHFTHRSSSGNYVIEIGYSTDAQAVGSYASFFRNGEPVRAATTAGYFQQVGSITTGTPGRITFPHNHGLVQNTPVRLYSTGALPVGTSEIFVYYVKPVDTRTIELSITNPVGASVAITTVGSGNLRVFNLSKTFPQVWNPPRVIPDLNWTSVGLKLTATSAAHGFRGGERVRMTTSGALPDGLSVSTDYFVVDVNAAGTTFGLATTQGGTGLPFVNAGSGTHTVSSRYVAGTVIYLRAANGGYPIDFYYCQTTYTETAADFITNSANWFRCRPDGTIRIPLPYAAGIIPLLTAESGSGRLVIANRQHPLREITGPFIDSTGNQWRTSVVALASTIPPPTIPIGWEVVPGESIRTVSISNGGSNDTQFRVEAASGPAVGDVVRCVSPPSLASGLTQYTLYAVTFGAVSLPGLLYDFKLHTKGGERVLLGGAPGPDLTVFTYTTFSADFEHRYKVTSVDDNDVESVASAEQLFSGSTGNDLTSPGAWLRFVWNAVPGAVRYRVYKEINGLYGYIGETTGLLFKDTNIGPDLSITPPLFDSTLTTGYPQAVSHYEQRRIIAGSWSYLQGIWASRIGQDNDFTYSLPIKDDDRIFAQIDAREAQDIRHIVPLGDLLIFTSRAEWRVTGPNGQTLTPSTISIRKQSEIGASFVPPVVADNFVLYESAQGGKLRALGYQFQRQSYVPIDLTLRASHLFDNANLTSIAYQSSPTSTVWATSSSGRLLACAFVPEEDVLGFSEIVSSGSFESVCVMEEEGQQFLYAVVVRNGVRHVERMQSHQNVNSYDAAQLDSYVSTYGTEFLEPWPLSARITRLGNLKKGSVVKVNSYTPGLGSTQVGFSPFDVGDYISFGIGIGFKIIGYTSENEVTCELLADLPVAYVGVELPNIAFGRRTIHGLHHLNGQTVTVLSDGNTVSYKLVTEGRIANLDVPSFYTHAGLTYECELTTLPVVIQTEAAGQGRIKDVTQAFLRLSQLPVGLRIGPDASNLVPVRSEDGAATANEYRVRLLGKYSPDGSITVLHTYPFTVTILGLTLETALGS